MIHLLDLAGHLNNAECSKAIANQLKRGEKDLYRKIRKALQHLKKNPGHPGLRSHEITVLTEKYGVCIWESHLENKRSGARHRSWIYGS
jgi:hypothetical protein